MSTLMPIVRLGIALASLALIAAPSGSALADDAAGGKNLVAFHVVGDAIPSPLTSQAGDPAAGLKIIEDRKLGNCLTCHSMPIKGADQGNVGPSLYAVGARLKPGQLRLRLVNMKLIDPTTIMPAYYRVAGLHDVAQAFIDKPILGAQQIEDVVAFLATLKTTGASQ